MTPFVLTVVAAVMPMTPPSSPRTVQMAGVALCIVALALVPARAIKSQMGHRMPEYGPIVRAARALAHRGQPLRAFETEQVAHKKPAR